MNNAKLFKFHLSCFKLLLPTLLIILLMPVTLYANGYAVYGLSSSAQAGGEAVVASINDSSAVWYNPALMTKLDGNNILLYGNNLFLDVTYTDISGTREKSSYDYLLIPAIYLTGKVLDDKLALGIGLNTPYGLATEYDKTSAFRYITTGMDLKVMNASLSAAYKVNETLSIGGGLNVYYAQGLIGSQYPWAAVEAMLAMPVISADGSTTLEVDGTGFGFNVGLSFTPLDKHSFGFVYRSQVKVDLDGEVELNGIPVLLQGSFSGSSIYRSALKTSLTVPDSITVGYAYKMSDKLTWEIDWYWWDWSDFNKLDFDIRSEVPVLLADFSVGFRWHDSWAIATGASYNINENLTVRGGYKFSKSPLRESAFSPGIPDLDYHVFSTGISYRKERFNVELPITVITTMGKKNIDSDVTDALGLGQSVDGAYQWMVYEIGLKLSYNF